MATSPNYGWEEPDDTDLVKDGALAIRTLGNAIDASMNAALGTKPAMGVLLNTTTVSGAAGISLNNVFNSTYDNYRIILSNFTVTSAGIVDIATRMRLSGSDAGGATDYAVQYARVYGAGTAANNGSTGQSSGSFGYKSTGGVGALVLDIMQPAIAQYTINTFMHYAYQSDIGGYIVAQGANVHKVSTAYDGISIYPASGNMSGTIRVYGYRNS